MPIKITGTLQEVFDQVYAGLAGQGWQRSTDVIICYYRHPDGALKCAAGHLIPDEDYRQEFEGDTFPTLVSKGYVEASPEVKHLVFKLQLAHDSQTGAGLQKKVEALAKHFGLTVPTLAQ